MLYTSDWKLCIIVGVAGLPQRGIYRQSWHPPSPRAYTPGLTQQSTKIAVDTSKSQQLLNFKFGFNFTLQSNSPNLYDNRPNNLAQVR